MNNEEFINGLIEAHETNVSDTLSELNEKLHSISVIKEDSDFYLEQENPNHAEFSKELEATGNLFKETARRIDQYRTAYEDQQRFVAVVDKLNTVDFQKIPMKIITGVKQNYDNEWGNAKLKYVDSIRFSSDKGFYLHMAPAAKAFIEWTSPLDGAFDTKDTKTTAILNEAGFFSFDQIQKIQRLNHAWKTEDCPYRTYVATLLQADKDPRAMLEQEFKTLSFIAVEWDAVQAKDFAYEYQDMSPVPLDGDTVIKLAKNGFMEPLEFVPKDDIPDPVILKRVKIGDCYLDFCQSWAGNDERTPISADLLIPKDKLKIAENHALQDDSLFDDTIIDKVNVFFRSLDYEMRKFRAKSDMECITSTLTGPDGDKFVRDFIASSEMKKTLAHVPTHCLIQDTYKPKFAKEKAAQR